MCDNLSLLFPLTQKFAFALYICFLLCSMPLVLRFQCQGYHSTSAWRGIINILWFHSNHRRSYVSIKYYFESNCVVKNTITLRYYVADIFVLGLYISFTWLSNIPSKQFQWSKNKSIIFTVRNLNYRKRRLRWFCFCYLHRKNFFAFCLSKIHLFSPFCNCFEIILHLVSLDMFTPQHDANGFSFTNYSKLCKVHLFL